MTVKRALVALVIVLAPVILAGQGKGIDPAQLLKPLGDSWPTHNGDYSGRRYSTLARVNRTTVKHLSLAWVSGLREGARGANVGGEGTIDFPSGGTPTVKASALMVDNTIYISTP